MKTAFWCFALLVTLPACERLLIEPDPASTPVTNFDLLWKTVDEKYSYFSYKNIDWNATYAKYRPLVRNDMRSEELFDIMADMLYELRDGHVNLISSFDVSRNWEWYLGYPPNYNPVLIERTYLNRAYEIAQPFRTRVIDSVGYIRYGSFQSGIAGSTVDRLVRNYAGLKGIIIDIRDNGGGSIANVDVLAGRFTNATVTVGYTRYKRGPGHDDFSQPYARKLKAAGRHYPGRVVVLTNRSAFSAANDFASVMAELPNVTLIGDQTGGGGGAPFSSELPNGWRFRFSTNQLLNTRMEQIEDGVPPDIKVDMRKADEDLGRDTILETALAFLR
ncbi:MAG: S41 family peptidase [Ferruginibacter sp.]|nr:S41 family peptidase [Cytophagales bacterium]